MCGRFTLHHDTEEIAQRFNLDNFTLSFQPRYNIAPTQPVAAVLQDKSRTLEPLHWGLIPFWAKDPKIGNRMINARAETIAEKPAFRAAFKYRRCLIPTSGYYEWHKSGDERIPTYIQRADAAPFAFAGLWEEWQAPEGDQLHSCTIITTQASDQLSAIHHRMPVIFNQEQEEAWLNPELQDSGDLLKLLQQTSDDELASHPVSKQVNVPTFDDPACIKPAA